MTAVSKNIYFDVLNDIADKYINTYHNSIKMKPIHVKSNSYAEYNVDSNAKDDKFKIGKHIIISKYKSIFAKGRAPNWSEEFFLIIKKNDLNDLNGEEIDETCYEVNCRRQINKNLE